MKSIRTEDRAFFEGSPRKKRKLETEAPAKFLTTRLREESDRADELFRAGKLDEAIEIYDSLIDLISSKNKKFFFKHMADTYWNRGQAYSTLTEGNKGTRQYYKYLREALKSYANCYHFLSTHDKRTWKESLMSEMRDLLNVEDHQYTLDDFLCAQSGYRMLLRYLNTDEQNIFLPYFEYLPHILSRITDEQRLQVCLKICFFETLEPTLLSPVILERVSMIKDILKNIYHVQLEDDAQFFSSSTSDESSVEEKSAISPLNGSSTMDQFASFSV